jgi:hypothetical protein
LFSAAIAARTDFISRRPLRRFEVSSTRLLAERTAAENNGLPRRWLACGFGVRALIWRFDINRARRLFRKP